MLTRLVPRDRRLRAFTLLELLVVMVVMGVLSTMAFVGMRAFAPRTQDNAALGAVGEFSRAMISNANAATATLLHRSYAQSALSDMSAQSSASVVSASAARCYNAAGAGVTVPAADYSNGWVLCGSDSVPYSAAQLAIGFDYGTSDPSDDNSTQGSRAVITSLSPTGRQVAASFAAGSSLVKTACVTQTSTPSQILANPSLLVSCTDAGTAVLPQASDAPTPTPTPEPTIIETMPATPTSGPSSSTAAPSATPTTSAPYVTNPGIIGENIVTALNATSAPITLPTWPAGTRGTIVLYTSQTTNGFALSGVPSGYTKMPSGDANGCYIGNAQITMCAFYKRMTDADSGATVAPTWTNSNSSVTTSTGYFVIRDESFLAENYKGGSNTLIKANTSPFTVTGSPKRAIVFFTVRNSVSQTVSNPTTGITYTRSAANGSGSNFATDYHGSYDIASTSIPQYGASVSSTSSYAGWTVVTSTD